MSKAVKITLSVLAVLAILAGVVYFFFVVPAMEGYLMRSRDTSRQGALSKLSLEIDTYWVDNDKYPENLEELSQNSLKPLPVDPLEGKKSDKCEFTYKYELSEDKKSYTLSACMEVENQTKYPNNIFQISK